MAFISRPPVDATIGILELEALSSSGQSFAEQEATLSGQLVIPKTNQQNLHQKV